MADATYISFYSKSGCIRIFKQSVRAIGLPKFIRFQINGDATSLILEPFDRITLTSFRVPNNLNDEEGNMEVYSKGLIYGLMQRLGWTKGRSYRVPGKVLPKQSIILYDLTQAQEIPNDGI
ncbi:MAG: hypothetical protein NC131_14905 [Roseburia sp.]|nr:hypothetical protein [Roseburia sp.]